MTTTLITPPTTDARTRLEATVKEWSSNEKSTYWKLARDLALGRLEEDIPFDTLKEDLEKYIIAEFGKEKLKSAHTSLNFVYKIGKFATKKQLQRWREKETGLENAFFEIKGEEKKKPDTVQIGSGVYNPALANKEGSISDIVSAQQNAELAEMAKKAQTQPSQPIPENNVTNKVFREGNPVPAFATWVMKRESLFIDLVDTLLGEQNCPIDPGMVVSFVDKCIHRFNLTQARGVVERILQLERFKEEAEHFINQNPTMFDIDFNQPAPEPKSKSKTKEKHAVQSQS